MTGRWARLTIVVGIGGVVLLACTPFDAGATGGGTDAAESPPCTEQIVQVTPSQREEHRRSFAFGNLSIENPRVTRELVERVAARIPPPLPDE